MTMADDASRICLSGSAATSAAVVSAIAPRQDVKNSGPLAGDLSFSDPLSLTGGLSSSPVSAAPVPSAVSSGGFPPAAAAAAHLVVPAASAVASSVSLVSPGRMPVLSRGTAAAGMASVAVSRLDAPDSTMSFSGLLLAEIASSRCQAPVPRVGLVPPPQQQSGSTAAAASIALPAAPVGATPPQQQQFLRGVSADDFRPSQTRVAGVTPGKGADGLTFSTPVAPSPSSDVPNSPRVAPPHHHSMVVGNINPLPPFPLNNHNPSLTGAFVQNPGSNPTVHHHLSKNSILSARPAPLGASTAMKQVPSRDLHFVSAGPPPLPSPETVPRRSIVEAGKGEGWPYAPQGWPSPDDKWGWRVGKRSNGSGHWIDRYVALPQSLAKATKTTEFASRKALIQYLKKTFPQINIDDFFKSFQWKVPSVEMHESSLPSRAVKAAERTRERPPLEDVSWQSAQKRSRKQCEAKNPNCSLERGTSILSGTVEGLDCDICCSEPGFCRECKCILCCQVISPDPDESTFIRCMHRPSGSGVCGHAAHLECALKSEMAGVVKHNGLDMEYLCRRCDSKVDLRELITRLVEVMGKTTVRQKVEKSLQLALQIMQDTQNGGFGGRILEYLVGITLKKIQKGADIQQAFKEFNEQGLAAEAGRQQGLGRPETVQEEGSVHQSEASLDQWLPSGNLLGTQPSPATPSSFTSQTSTKAVPLPSSSECNGHKFPDAIICTKPSSAEGQDAEQGQAVGGPDSSVLMDKFVADRVAPEKEDVKAVKPLTNITASQSIGTMQGGSIEEHMKQCESLANRVKGAGQLMLSTTKAVVGYSTPSSGGDSKPASLSLGSATGKTTCIDGAGSLGKSPQLPKNGSSLQQEFPVSLSEDIGLPNATGGVLVSQSSGTSKTETLSSSNELPGLERTVNGTVDGTQLVGKGTSITSAGWTPPVTFGVPGSLVLLGTPLHQLESQYEDDIQLALKKLKETQAAEYEAARESLLAQRRVVLDHCQQLETARCEFAKQKSRASMQEFDHCTDSLVNEFGKVQEERKVFKSMLAIANGFGQVPKDILSIHFGWPPKDFAGGC